MKLLLVMPIWARNEITLGNAHLARNEITLGNANLG
jgi:hypothetical protein